MANLIACRLASYGEYQDRAWAHLPKLGITHMEIPVPAPVELDAVIRRLAEHGLKASSLQARCDVTRSDAVTIMRPQLDACAALGARICFLSAKAGDADRAVVFQRLQEIGDEAAKLDVTVALETHPDLITNGEIARQSMAAIDHPHVRVNFDTANIYFYNEGANAVDELAKTIDDVVSVHLKDTTGVYQDWTFPALGTGVVDFPEIIQMLNARGFAGPFTMELEGTKGVQMDEPTHLAYIARSVEYLREIGAFK